MSDILHKFYCSKAFIDLAYMLKIKSEGVCVRCGDNYHYQFSDLRVHHKVELNEQNVNDPKISLNTELLEVLCHKHHNLEHNRFTTVTKKVFIIYGSPLSGKDSYVNQIAGRNDLICNIDKLWAAVTNSAEYDKPETLKAIVFNLRNTLLDNIKCRYGKWNNAYIIGGYPDAYERERIAKELGAKCIYIESTKEECIRRLYKDAGRLIYKDKWLEYIEDWWRRYSLTPP